MPKSYVYVTKSVNADFTAHRDGVFKYPKRGMVEAPDWRPNQNCGNGLHGFLWGEGRGDLAQFNESIWLLIKVDINDGLVDLGGKVKFRRGNVIAHGDYKTIAEKIKKHLPCNRVYNVIGGTATAGFKGTAMAGDGGTATAGNGGTAMAGDGGTAMAGFKGTATAGFKGTATAGDGGTAMAGDGGTATAGNGGTAMAGNGGTATAGDEGIIIITYWDDNSGKWRKKIGQIGIDGLEPNIQYTLDTTHNFIKVGNGK